MKDKVEQDPNKSSSQETDAKFVDDNQFVSDQEEEENKTPRQEMFHGGSADCPSCGVPYDECGCDESYDSVSNPLMGIMATSVGKDPISGNVVPLGSSEENVRDDIPAALSSGEYVVPADVVRWHGLKQFVSLREEAKMGLMSMAFEGQIRSLEDEETHMMPDGSEMLGATHEEYEEEYETPEGTTVERPSVETEEETMDLDKDEDADDYASNSKKYTYKPNVKVATIK